MKTLKKHKGLFILLVLTAMLMAGTTAVDRSWTLKLNAHKWPGLEQWMNRSVFKGDVIGINDMVIFYLLGVVLVYYLGWRSRPGNPMTALRPQCGFVLTSALIGAVYLVQGLKWMVGRARPAEVLSEGWPYSHWFAFGPHFVTEGIFSGSFPSGHTAQIFILMTLAYALAADPGSGRTARIAGWVWGAACLVLGSAMAAARCMSLSHWLSDCLGSIVFGWIVTHLVYFYLLNVPQQRQYIHTRGTSPEVPLVWEVRLCLYLFAATLGIMALVIGTRALMIDKGPWLVLMVPVGAGTIWLSRQRSLALLQTVWIANDADPNVIGKQNT